MVRSGGEGSPLPLFEHVRPPVDLSAVSLHQHDLGRHVLDGAARGIRTLALRQLLGEAEVDELQEAVGADHQILGLEVTVDVAARVHVLEHQRDRADDEAGEALGEAAARLGEDRPELAARDVIHRHHQPEERRGEG